MPCGALGLRELYIRRHTEVHQMKFDDPLSAIYRLNPAEATPSHLMLDRNSIWVCQVSTNINIYLFFYWEGLLFFLSIWDFRCINTFFSLLNMQARSISLTCSFFCAGSSSQKTQCRLARRWSGGDPQKSWCKDHLYEVTVKQITFSMVSYLLKIQDSLCNGALVLT